MCALSMNSVLPALQLHRYLAVQYRTRETGTLFIHGYRFEKMDRWMPVDPFYAHGSSLQNCWFPIFVTGENFSQWLYEEPRWMYVSILNDVSMNGYTCSYCYYSRNNSNYNNKPWAKTNIRMTAHWLRFLYNSIETKRIVQPRWIGIVALSRG